LKKLALSLLFACLNSFADAAPAQRPNIILILSDDVGYGDLTCYGATHVRTPNLDRLAKEGVRFRDAHSTASVCTPTRFALLTGKYAWRQKGTGIAPGDSPLLISPGSATLPALLKQAGYRTGAVGKWHLGFGETRPDFNGELRPGPLEIGFDYAYLVPATGDRVPCVYVENHRVAGLDPQDPIAVSYGQRIGTEPTGLERPDLLKIKADRSHSQTIVNGISRIGYMTGGRSALWTDEDMADQLTQKAVQFIEGQKPGEPFFLYMAPHDIHEPMVPHPRFRGTSGCGWRGDVIHQLDWTVGQLLASLERRGVLQDTLVIFSSDNGGAIKNTYDDGTNALHGLQQPNGALRGAKGSLYEGGHRVPMLARWPGKIPAGKESDALVALVDLPRSLAALAGQTLPEGAAPDSQNVLPALLGSSDARGRESLVLQSNGERPLALRQGNWKLIQGKGSAVQLYDLLADPAESRDLAKEQPERVAAMQEQLAGEIARVK
jgi:arylsulfatase A-like enzyme